jgi:hypothetical protein
MCGRRAVPALVALMVALSACGSSAGGPTAYDKKAADAAAEVVSAARTVLFAARVGGEAKTFVPTATVTIEDVEADASSAVDRFATAVPPDAASDGLRADVLPQMQRALDVIELVRIAARRGDTAALESTAAPLDPLSTRLDAFASSFG